MEKREGEGAMTSVDITDFCPLLPPRAHHDVRRNRGNVIVAERAQRFDRVLYDRKREESLRRNEWRIDFRAVVAIRTTMEPSSKYGNSKFERGRNFFSRVKFKRRYIY